MQNVRFSTKKWIIQKRRAWHTLSKKKSQFKLSVYLDVAINQQVFKAAIIKFKEGRKTMNEDLMESMTKMNKVVVLKKEVEIIERTKWRFYDWKAQ